MNRKYRRLESIFQNYAEYMATLCLYRVCLYIRVFGQGGARVVIFVKCAFQMIDIKL